MPDPVEHEPAWRSGEDIQRLANVLDDVPIPAQTRRALIGRACQGLAAAGGGGLLLAACGGGSQQTGTATQASAGAPSPPRRGRSPELQTLLNDAVTAEAFAVTYLSQVLERAPGTYVEQFVDVLKAANQSEYLHYEALTALGAKPLTTRFWFGDELFGPQLVEVFTVLEMVEALFVNLYLIATTEFANAGNATLARYSAEISAVEGEHLVLARYAASQAPPKLPSGPPNDLAFTYYASGNINDILEQLKVSDVGVGKRVGQFGRFFSFAPPPAGTTVPLLYPTPT